MTSAGGGLGDLMRDPDEAIRRVNDWAEGFARKAERYAAAQERTAELKLTASSPDGTVKVTVGADGIVSDLVFSSRTRSIPPEELAHMVLSTMRRAQSGITAQVAEVMQEQLGDEDRQTREAMLGALRERFPEPEDPEDGPPAPPPIPAPPPGPPPGGAGAPPSAAPPSGATPPAGRAGSTDPDEEDNTPW